MLGIGDVAIIGIVSERASTVQRLVNKQQTHQIIHFGKSENDIVRLIIL